MTIKLLKEPEYIINLDTDILVERYEFENKFSYPVFKIGEEFIDLKYFAVELHRKNNSTEIENILIMFPEVPEDIIYGIAEYKNTPEEELKKIEALKKANLLFSLKPEVIAEYIQPEYDSPEKSKNIFGFTDNNDIPIILDFDNYVVEGLQTD